MQKRYLRKSMVTITTIDEFRGNANRVKYQLILTDLATGKPIDILPNRYESNITGTSCNTAEKNETKSKYSFLTCSENMIG